MENPLILPVSSLLPGILYAPKHYYLKRPSLIIGDLGILVPLILTEATRLSNRSTVVSGFLRSIYPRDTVYMVCSNKHPLRLHMVLSPDFRTNWAADTMECRSEHGIWW